MSNTNDKNAAVSSSLDGLVLCLKEATGIDKANCETCSFQGFDCAGSDDPQEPTWPICTKHPHFENLKSFPFKKERNCWRPEFWHSKFVDRINGDEENDSKVFADFRASIEEAENAQNQRRERSGIK